ncbi:MAG: chemotaxis protein CheR [Magnetococcales bacterium]|nr:chemotaxis protein CheR [Magnetococcales bacterium]
MRVTESEFRLFEKAIYDFFGILIPKEQRPDLSLAISTRLSALKLTRIQDYLDLIAGTVPDQEEWFTFIDLLSNQSTGFFHDAGQFEFLVQNAIPELIRTVGAGVRRPLILWSAGCGSGEEAYTLAIVLSEFSRHYPGFRFSFNILGTDISRSSLTHGEEAVYDLARIDPVPLPIKKLYFLKSRDKQRKQVRLTPEIRRTVRFRLLNFMDGNYRLREKMDIVFCRNVIGYFDDTSRTQMLQSLAENMVSGGYLFLGSKETITHPPETLQRLSSSLFRRQ